MRNKGLTLTELLVVMVILIIVLTAVFKSYLVVFKTHVQQSKIAESNIEKLMGLEILRKDIEMAGFGLPWDVNGIGYSEAESSSSYTPDPADFNDAPSDPPCAFAFSNDGNTNANNSDVLVIKSSIANINNKSARTWGYAYYDGSDWIVKSLSTEEFETGDYFIAVNTDDSRELCNNSGAWNFEYSATQSPDLGSNHNVVYFVFGLYSSQPRMPFNRVDYYLKKPNDGFPTKCNPDTYELYRAEIINSTSGGTRQAAPIFDCVADFQVAFGLDTDRDGTVDSWQTDLSGLTSAQDIRENVRQLAIYIVYQEGQKDKPSIYTQTSIDIKAPDGTTNIKTVDLTKFSDYRQYRWKLIQMIVNPLNLIPQERVK